LLAHPYIGVIAAFFAAPLYTEWVKAKKFFEPKASSQPTTSGTDLH
jgi:hypothetical protein